MNRTRLLAVFMFLFAGLLACGAAAAQGKPYDLSKDIQYNEVKGRPMLVNIYKPNGQNANPFYKPGDAGKGLGLIDVISGGWNSSPGRENEHLQAGVFDILCSGGYTVFAVRVGSLPDFNGLEITENLQYGIRWVKEHAAEHGVDPDRLGMMGASAGGHLSLLAMLRAVEGDPKAEDPVLRHGTQVRAVAAFFPPTNFLNWGGGPVSYSREPSLLFTEGLDGKTEEELRARMEALSPALQAKPGMPPVLLVHGDSDPVVPLDQSEQMVAALKEKGNEASLVVKKDGGHFWLTIPEEILLIRGWFDTHLAK